MKKKSKVRKVIDWITSVLLIVGGLNWGLVGAFSYDVVSSLLGSMPLLVKGIYISVGLSALWVVLMLAMRKFMK